MTAVKRSAPQDDRSTGAHDSASSPRKRQKRLKVQAAGPSSASSAVPQADNVSKGTANDTNVTSVAEAAASGLPVVSQAQVRRLSPA